jgi:excisionase family DNA binding protein
MNIQASELQREGLSITETSQVAGIGRTKIYEAIAAGTLKARKYGKRTIVLRSDLQDFLTGLPVVG